jgi:hypothetical protein
MKPEDVSQHSEGLRVAVGHIDPHDGIPFREQIWDIRRRPSLDAIDRNA